MSPPYTDALPTASPPADAVPRWAQVHERIRHLGRARARHDHEEGQQLVLARRLEVHLRLGFASFAEYVERFLGHSRKRTKERLRVAEALQQLPLLDESLREGRLCWSVVRELSRVATPETEEAWLAATASAGAREVERRVSRHRPGDLPTDPPSREPAEVTLSLTLTPSTVALLREVRGKLTEQTGEALDDDTFVALLCQQVLGDTAEPGRAGHQIAYTVCEHCRQATQTGGGEAVPVEAAVVEAARCDAQHIGRVDAPGATPRASHDIPPAVRRLVLARHHGQCAVPGCSHGIVDIHHIELRSEGGSHDPERLVPLCRSGHHKLAHVGRLVVTGKASEGFRFFHADGTPYGTPTVDAGRAGLLSSIHQVLRDLGFKEREVRAALHAVGPSLRASMDPAEAVSLALASIPSPRRSVPPPSTLSP